MGGGGGAVVAIMAAAKKKRLQEVVDGFRIAEATSPDRARRLDEIGVSHLTEAEELMVDGVLVAGRRDGTFYLSEPGYIARRDRRRVSAKITALVAILAMAIVLGIALVIRVGRQ